MGKLILVALSLTFLFGGWAGYGSYNSMVDQREAVHRAWAQVENVYQRRADLIPNLVKTVQAYASHEQATFTAVTEARSKASSIQVDPRNLTPQMVSQFSASQGELSAALGRLMVVVERYPELKANEGFLQLQAQLEGTENRISVERGTFNATAEAYNRTVQRLPGLLFARLFGFAPRPYFEAAAGADTAPDVDFAP